MIDFTVWPHPVLAVACPSCGRRAGVMCRRPSGHKAADFHARRKGDADRHFIDRHGPPDASIERTVDGRRIDPKGQISEAACCPRAWQSKLQLPPAIVTSRLGGPALPRGGGKNSPRLTAGRSFICTRGL